MKTNPVTVFRVINSSTFRYSLAEIIKLMIRIIYSFLKQSFCYLMLFALILSNSSNAQIFRMLKDIDAIEATVGPNLYNMHYKDESPTDQVFVKPGLTATVNLHYQFKPQIDVSLRLFYDNKGYVNKFVTNYWDSTSASFLPGKIQAETFSHYTGLAVLAKLNIKNTNLFFEAGPFASYFIKGRVEFTRLWNNSTYKRNIDDDNRFSGGLSISVGYNIPISNSLSLSFRIIENLNLIGYISDTISFQVGVRF